MSIHNANITGDICSYTDATLGDGTGAIEGASSRKFEFVRGQYRNRVTGIPGAARK
jgi:hypothetical protein